MATHQVMQAERYRWGAMGSLGNASYMILNQHNFPAEYDDEKDVLIGADHDRCQMWDYDHFRRCCDKHLHTGELAIGQWVMDHDPKTVMAFLVEALKANEQYPDRKWTGWRVLGSVHRGNGYPIYYLQVISQKSKFKRFKGQTGDNVKGCETTLKGRRRSLADYDPFYQDMGFPSPEIDEASDMGYPPIDKNGNLLP